MAKNNAITNTDRVMQTDRQAVGKQPDNTPATGGGTTGGGGGSGTVTSVALALPSSILAVSGSPVTTSGTLAGSLQTQSANHVWAGPTSGAAATPTFRLLVSADLPSVPTTLYFNVKDYGALGDGSADDTAAILSATTAAAAISTTGKGTVFFPGGDYKITDEITLPGGFTGSIRFLGAGRRNARIVQATNGKNGFNLDLSSGTRENNSAEVSDLGVYCSVATGLTAVLISYGTTNISSSENRSGSVVQRVDINNTAFTNNGTGWTDGVRMVNAWHHRISDCFCCLQQTGSGTVGTGAGFRASSGINYSWDNLCVTIGNQAYLIDSVGGGQGAQGVLLNQLNAVSVDKYLNISGTACQTIILTNWQSDQEFAAVTSGIVASGVGSLFIGYGNVLIHTATGIDIDNCTNVVITNIRVDGVSSPVGINIHNSSNGVIVSDSSFGGCSPDVAVGAGCGFVDCDCAGTITTGGGTGNLLGRTVGYSTVVNLAGGSPTESFNVNVSASRLASKPNSAPADCVDPFSAKLRAVYDYANASNSATTAYFLAYMSDGSNLPSGLHRFSMTVGP